MITHFARLALVSIILPAGWGAAPTAAQSVGDEVKIRVAGIAHLRTRISEQATDPAASIVFDPAVLEDGFRAGAPDSLRALLVAEQLNLEIRAFDEATDCPERLPCRLDADVLLRFGRPLVQGESAKVTVAYWWRGRPEWRDPMPARVVELSLTRSAGTWAVTQQRTLLMSVIPMVRSRVLEQLG